MRTNTRATLDDLYRVDAKAELVHGEIVTMAPAGDDPGFASLQVASRLLAYTEQTRRGRAYGDGVGFHVQLPHRASFSPDAAYYVGARTGMRFLEGAPLFAVEIRSANDYGPAAEREMAAKRADYFACGTLVVWDVDLLSPEVIRSSEKPRRSGRGGKEVGPTGQESCCNIAHNDLQYALWKPSD